VGDVYAQERVCLGIERQLIMVVHSYYELDDTLLTLADEYEGVVDEQDYYEGGFLLCDLVEQAVVHVAHDVSFCNECLSIVSGEVST
jgi:hypothetical protein